MSSLKVFIEAIGLRPALVLILTNVAPWLVELAVRRPSARLASLFFAS